MTEEKEQKPPWKWLDRAMNYLITADTQAFLDLLLGKGVVRFLGLLAQRVDGDRLVLDTLVDTETVEGCIPTLVHIEFETAYSSKIGHRLLVYNEQVAERHPDREVESGVFHLNRGRRLNPGPYIRRTPLRPGSENLIFRYTVVEIQDLTPEDLRALGSPALLALVPLTQGGTEWPAIQDMFRDLIAYGDLEMTKIAFEIAYRELPDELKERLRKEYLMIYQEVLADPLYADIAKEKHAEGFEEGLARGREREESLLKSLQEAQQQAAQVAQQMVISLIVRDYPELKKLAQTRIANINSIERLQGLILDLALLHTQVEVGRFLLSLTPSQPQGDEQTIQATQKTAIEAVAQRFPELEKLAQSRLPWINDQQRLLKLILDLFVLSSQEVESVLSSLNKEPLPE